MNKTVAFIIGIIILLFLGYKYFHLDKNAAFQKSIKEKDFDSAEVIIKDAVSVQLQTQARKFFYDHNNYFISQSNNICTSLQSKFDALKKIIDNPVECVAEVHTFTARIKTATDKYYCADASGFYTTALDEQGYKSGISCK
jgi:transposase